MANVKKVNRIAGPEASTKEQPERKSLRKQIKNNSVFFELKFEGGGELPIELSGVFTSERDADLAIAKYEAKRAQ